MGELKQRNAQIGQGQEDGSMLEGIIAVIQDLIVPHRKRISRQGRQNPRFEGRIVFPGFEDVHYQNDVEPGYDEAKIANRAEEVFGRYGLSVISKTQYGKLVVDIEKARHCAISALENYLANHRAASISLMHQGLFSPRYHGETGRVRAQRFIELLNEPQDPSAVLYAIFAGSNGQTLQEEVMDFMGIADKNIFLSVLVNQKTDDHFFGAAKSDEDADRSAIREEIQDNLVGNYQTISDYVEGRTHQFAGIVQLEDAANDFREAMN